MPAMSSRGRNRRTVNEINMVPFIDVMLVLLIIFMVTAPMLTPGSINVPSAGKSRAADQEHRLCAAGQGWQHPVQERQQHTDRQA